ncbi:decarboxylase NovR [Paenibacillus sp. 32O-W]|jgi:Ribulose-5-phosphate 4-epimerase and related epimerases and aldolases|uniref:Class II aldolase/adducin family protein n=1 Tax=Paenibacillus cisolokensis TaxID=1658519 RepID=A0ABQ4N0F5_9BACL|nr:MULTISPECIES: class II aldolase/adducin family protein [Paenibacillus]ALS27218.1 decarboxylase NovR [Paenibacillus sp. 32O-W]GIQ61639.1 class II aldolase/adducin family protein [Paenibacillus cisolokensis]
MAKELQPLYVQPEFTSIEEERQHRKERLAVAFRLFDRFGFNEGVAGHITVRDPEKTDHYWVNPLGVHFKKIRVSDLHLVNHAGEVIVGNRPINKAAIAIHTQIHRARPDVIAAAHSHSLYGKAWSALGRLLDPLTQDSCVFYEDHGLYDNFGGVVLDQSEGERIAKALGSYKAVILRNHGLLTVGTSVDEAAYWFIAMDRACHAQLLAEAAGNPKPIDHETAKLTHSQLSRPDSGWYNFQPLYEILVEEQPDVLL